MSSSSCIRGLCHLPGSLCRWLEVREARSNLARLEPGRRRVTEAEINPLIVKADGVIAVDGLVVLEEDPHKVRP